MTMEPDLQFEAIQEPGSFLKNIDEFLSRCPVAHGYDREGRFTVVHRYEDVLRVVQDWRTFQTGPAVRVPALPENIAPFELPPMTSNPPIQRHFRELLNPYLTPAAVAPHEEGIREIAGTLLDGFIESGSDDIVGLVTQPFSPVLTFRFLLNVGEEEIEDAREFVREALYEAHVKDTSQAEMRWHDWNLALLERRRHEPRRNDMVDALLHGTVDGGRLLTESEQIGAINILMRGGFTTTTDASSNLLARLAEDPELASTLAHDPALIPLAIDESLRLDAPVSALARQCMADTSFGDIDLPAGERVLFNIAAANRDPEQFPNPSDFVLDRRPNRHLSFGGGVHRCIGLNFARLSLRVLFEEVFKRMHDLRLTAGQEVRRYSSEGQFFIPSFVPLAYERGPATSAVASVDVNDGGQS